MMKIFAVVVTVVALALGGCVTMEDCCECLVQSGGLECSEGHDQCVDQCFDLCEPTKACYCSNARRVGCEAECGCDGLF